MALPESEYTPPKENPHLTNVREAAYRLLQQKEGIFVEMITKDPWINIHFDNDDDQAVPETIRSLASSMYPGRDVRVSDINILFNGPETDFRGDMQPKEDEGLLLDEDERLRNAFTRKIRRFMEPTTPFQITINVSCEDAETERETVLVREELPPALYIREASIVRFRTITVMPFGKKFLSIVPQITLDQWLESPEHDKNTFELHMPYFGEVNETFFSTVANTLDQISREDSPASVHVEYT